MFLRLVDRLSARSRLSFFLFFLAALASQLTRAPSFEPATQSGFLISANKKRVKGQKLARDQFDRPLLRADGSARLGSACDFPTRKRRANSLRKKKQTARQQRAAPNECHPDSNRRPLATGARVRPAGCSRVRERERDACCLAKAHRKRGQIWIDLFVILSRFLVCGLFVRKLRSKPAGSSGAKEEAAVPVLERAMVAMQRAGRRAWRSEGFLRLWLGFFLKHMGFGASHGGVSGKGLRRRWC